MSQKLNYGGQAVIEGVMMRGAHIAAIAVRNPNGEIVIREEPLNKALYRGWVSRTPFIRGLVGLWDAVFLGTRALMWSAGVAEGDPSEMHFKPQEVAGVVTMSLSMGIGLFFLLPAAGSSAIGKMFGLENRLAVDALEGGIKMAIFVGYMAVIGMMEDVKRLFGYHGAEHKTINAYEADADLSPENVQYFPLEHPRCGTAFLLTVVVLSIFVHTLVGRPNNIFLLLLSRLAVIPVIAGLAYEILRFTAKNASNPIVKAMIAPNLAMQKLTTREPDEDMLEVAIAAFERVLAAEADEDGEAFTAIDSAESITMPTAAAINTSVNN